MKAMVLKEYNRFMETMEVEKPVVGENDVLIRVKACGICRTDLKIFRGEIPPPIVTLPHTPGHEVAGEVVEIGDKVTGIQKGDVGILYIYIACRNCEWCLAGHENLCPSLKRVGFELPGGYAQYVRVPAYAFCPFDRKLSFNEMAILPDAVATAYRAITTLADVKLGQKILIVGAGGLGIHGVQIARLCGAEVLVAEKKKKALDLAGQFGADFLIDAREKPFRSNQGDHEGERRRRCHRICGVERDALMVSSEFEKRRKTDRRGLRSRPTLSARHDGHALQ